MKRIDLRMNEQQKYEVIKSLVDHDGSRTAAAVKLGCTYRHINRLIKKYKEKAKKLLFMETEAGNPSTLLQRNKNWKLSQSINNKYFDAAFAYACELPAENDGIYISPSPFTKIMHENFITSPRTTKAVRRRPAKELRSQQNSLKSKQKRDEIQAAVVAVEDSHSPRPRCSYFGEMLQMDASVHLWFGDSKTNLHTAIDDSTSRIVGACFDEQES